MAARRFWLHVILAALALSLGCWLSSGTLAPYGTHSWDDCHYRYNIDHDQFRQVFLMLEGKPASEWHQSVVLRRVLHPILAYPWVEAFGFEVGGFLFNVFSHVVALVGLAVAFRRFFDARAAVLTTWLFASYPGYAYWVGLPYSYAFIVPGCIACVIALLWFDRKASLARSLVAACVVGFIGLGYDLIPFFGGALLLLLLAQRRWRDLAASAITLAAWLVFIGKGLPLIFGFDAVNSNTLAYGEVVKAWLDAWNRHGWGELLVRAPWILVSNFIFSGFVLFPLLLVWMVALRARWRLQPLVPRVALAILLATLSVWAFLNLAPPYTGAWQLRGTWIPRLFQPWFVALFVVVAATVVAVARDPRRYKVVLWSVVAIAVIDGAVIAGPFVHLTRVWATVHQRFYVAPFHNKNSTWLTKLGRRPIGFCE